MSRSDPTRTVTLRNAFAKEMRKRVLAFTKDVVSAIVEDDCFGLEETTTLTINRSSPGKKAFAFLRDDAKIESFIRWLQVLKEQHLLNIVTMPQIGSAIHQRWTDMYLESAYSQGLVRATVEMRNAGMDVPSINRNEALELMKLPVHADRAAVIYTRAYSSLTGITDAMDTQISQILSQAMIEGKGAREIAGEIANVLMDSNKGNATTIIGRFVSAKRRAETLARTEIIRAHHLAMVQQYRNWGVVGVHVQAEWRTAGDDRVCPLCEKLEGKVFTLDEIEDKIPLHPNCRCMILPWSERILEFEQRS